MNAGALDLPRVVADIRDRFPVSGAAHQAGVKLLRAGRELKGCCPFHPDRTPSFTIYGSDRRYKCFGCSAEGDVLDFVQRMYGVRLFEAIEMLDGGVLRSLEQQRAPAKPKADLLPLVRRIVAASVPIEGTPAERYLRSRGITIPLPVSLRFTRLAPPQIEGNGLLAANGPDPIPAMVAIVTNVSGELVGLQRTYLTESGCKAATVLTESDPKPKVRYSLANVRGGAVRLADHAGGDLGLCEAVEDGLSLMEMGAPAVWAAAGAGMLHQMELPASAQDIVIGGDADTAGVLAAERAASVFAEQGRRVRVIYPANGAKDFNADLMEAADASH